MFRLFLFIVIWNWLKAFEGIMPKPIVYIWRRYSFIASCKSHNWRLMLKETIFSNITKFNVEQWPDVIDLIRQFVMFKWLRTLWRRLSIVLTITFNFLSFLLESDGVDERGKKVNFISWLKVGLYNRFIRHFRLFTLNWVVQQRLHLHATICDTKTLQNSTSAIYILTFYSLQS